MARDSFAADAERLLAGSRRVIAASRAPEGMLPDPVTSDAVRVTDGRDGRPQITIHATWERSLPAGDLGNAVTGALAAFHRSNEPVGSSAEDVEPWSPTVPTGDLTPALNRLNAALAESSAQLSAVMRRLSGEASPTITGDRGHVRVAVEDGRAGVVTIDPSWASGKSGATVAMEVGNVLADALAVEPLPVKDPMVTDPYAALAFLKETL